MQTRDMVDVVKECDNCRAFYKRIDKEEKQPLLTSCEIQVRSYPVKPLLLVVIYSTHIHTMHCRSCLCHPLTYTTRPVNLITHNPPPARPSLSTMQLQRLGSQVSRMDEIHRRLHKLAAHLAEEVKLPQKLADYGRCYVSYVRLVANRRATFTGTHMHSWVVGCARQRICI